MLDALADLRHRALQRAPNYLGGPDALALHRSFVQQAHDQGALDALVVEGRARAFCGAWFDPEHSFFRTPLQSLLVHHDGSNAALAWLDRALPALLAAIPDDQRPHLDCLLPAWDRPSRERLLSLGLGLCSVNLAGRVPTVLSRLREVYDPPADLSAQGLQLEPYDVADADAVLALHQTIFTDEPAFAWFGAAPPFLASLAASLREPAPHSTRLVVRREGRLVGEVHAQVRDPDPHHGSALALGFALSREIRGLGVAKVLYRRLLEDADNRGVGWLKGTTGRRSILHMARLLHRDVVGVTLRQQPTFTDGRFDHDLALAEAAALPWRPPAPATGPATAPATGSGPS